MTQSNARRKKQIRAAIEPDTAKVIDEHRAHVVVTCSEDCWCWSLEENLVNSIDEWYLAQTKPEMPTDDDTERKVKLIDDMIKHVDSTLGIQLDYGKRKWAEAIKYLIKVKAEKNWDIQVMWMHLNSDELKYKKEIPSIGSIMKDPEEVIKNWMPIAHAAGENNARNDSSPTPTDADRKLVDKIKARREARN